MTNKRNEWLWIPTLYFASGLPYHAITNISDMMYKNMGISNEQIAMYTSLLLIPWTVKPIWSPFVEMIRTRRLWIIGTQFIMAICFALIAILLPTEIFLIGTLAVFLSAAFVSATHDIAADGFYMLGLNEERQSFFSGIRNTAYRIATVFSSGVLVMIAGKIASDCNDYVTAWGTTFIIVAIIMLLFVLYHKYMLPKPKNDVPQTTNSIGEAAHTFKDIIVTYFKKPNIVATLLFLLLFRLPEAQLVKMGKLFLMDPISEGGLGLSNSDIGFINGIIGVVGLIIGGIAGGICISRKGLRYWLWPMVAAISLPDLVYVYLSMAQPAEISIVGSCIFIEQLGYGFGFTAYTLYMIYFAQGKYPTAHFAISTAFMSLGMMLPGMISGHMQKLLGYEHFFIWVMLCCAVTFIVSALVKIAPEFGRKE